MDNSTALATVLRLGAWNDSIDLSVASSYGRPFINDPIISCGVETAGWRSDPASRRPRVSHWMSVFSPLDSHSSPMIRILTPARAGRT
jgi:hypothetical protein